MRDQVFMSPNNAQLVVGIPLFRHHYSQPVVANVGGMSYSMYLDTNVPLAYVIDAGTFCQVLGAEWVDKNLINLGYLEPEL